MYLVNSPQGLGVTDGHGSFELLATAFDKYRDVINALLKAGDVKEATFVGDKCYIGDRTFNFIIGTGITYPDEYNTQYVEEIAEMFGAKISGRSFGDYTASTFNEDCFLAMKAYCKDKNISWVLLPENTEPVPEDAVLVKEEIEKADGFDMDAIMAAISDETESSEDVVEPEPVDQESVYPEQAEEEIETPLIKQEPMYPEQTAEEIETPPIKQEPVTPVSIESSLAEYTKMLIPNHCKGESYAFTDDFLTLDKVEGDAYCIENNWEKRGEYWIIDVPQRGVRMICSDRNNYKHEYRLDDCR